MLRKASASSKRDLDRLQADVPAIHAAPAFLQIARQDRQERGLHQAEHRMRLRALAGFLGHGKGQVGILLAQRRQQPLGQVGRQEGRIAGGGEQKLRLAAPHAGFHAGQRPGETGQVVRPHRYAERGIRVEVLVGVDRHAGHLRGEPLEDVRGHGLAAERLQALVDLAHARAASAGEDQAADRCLLCHFF